MFTPEDEDEAWYSSSEEEEGRSATEPVTDPEVWSDYHSEFLVTLYHQLKDSIAGMGVYVLDKSQFSDFVDYCFAFSSGRKPPC